MLISPTVGLEVSTTVNLVGNGTVDHEAEVNTHQNYEGLKYTEGFYTRSLGWYANSSVIYSSDFSLVASDKMNSTIDVTSSFELSNAKQDACLRNYNIEAIQGFKTYGKSVAAYAFSGTNHTSQFDLIQEVYEGGRYKLAAKNLSDRHIYTYLDKADYCGNYTLELSSFFGTPYWPAAGCDDYLSCPGGASWNTGTIEP